MYALLILKILKIGIVLSQNVKYSKTAFNYEYIP